MSPRLTMFPILALFPANALALVVRSVYTQAPADRPGYTKPSPTTSTSTDTEEGAPDDERVFTCERNVPKWTARLLLRLPLHMPGDCLLWRQVAIVLLLNLPETLLLRLK